MKFQSHLLVTYLLLLFFSPRGVMVEENMVWGILAQSISLDIPDLPKGQEIDDIRWSEGQTLIGKVSSDKVTTGKNTNYEIFINGTLKIRELKAVSEQNYTVSVYNKNGKNLLKKTLTLNVMEAVSKPEMTWNCTLKSIFCVTQNGTNPEMTLYINGTHPLKKGTLTKEGLKLKYTWEDPLPREFKCVVKNKVSEEWVVGQPSCSDQNLECNSTRVNMEERSRKLHQSPGHHPQQSGGRHPQQPGGHRPQAPGHHLQVPGHCPPVPGHRPRPQPKRHPPNIQQQSGPPLPRPRNQQRSPHQEKEYR
ncbi:T-cell surface antigen CD2 isoform X2 [Macrotis lagotis]|uniref:T-cell surface antigen CD2 isoform X2 n=1 Tax=Macrotis lagotis TaxID=92651 RepID=UPI003D69A260